MSTKIGFIGLGAMGEPMARNLAKAGYALVVWNRTAAKSALLASEGAMAASTPADVFERTRIVFLMLSDDAAIDAVLARQTSEFVLNVRDHTIINTATVAPHYSDALAADIARAGGAYVEAPVSGSRKPAETGQLIAMLAGDEATIQEVLPLFASMCRATIVCGPRPRALQMKIATNIFLIATITGLAESANFATRSGFDMNAWAQIINASPMASDISRAKVEKLLAGEFSPQAAIANVFETNRLVTEAARHAGVAAPLMDASPELYRQAVSLGLDRSDMIAVVDVLSARSRGQP
jgi:3-hydroxyisobutyrate dehydrogenase